MIQKMILRCHALQRCCCPEIGKLAQGVSPLAILEINRIEKRGRPIGVLTAWRHAARRRAIWGNRVFAETGVAAMRADELEGEEG